ncbi:MAG: HDOD domain-containing protein [Gallionellaceae bacterium]|nr:HDOD domain-containing protein [Gallionellaceae bacterium]
MSDTNPSKIGVSTPAVGVAADAVSSAALQAGTIPMSQRFDLRLLIYALSDALDLVSGDNHCHGKRVALIAVACGRQLGFSPKVKNLLFYISLMRDCGISSTAMQRKLLHAVQDPDIEAHCLAGARLMTQSLLLAPLADIVRHHHTPWTELQKLDLGKEAKILSNLVFLADRANALIVPHLGEPLVAHKETIRHALNVHRNELFAPDQLDAFLAVSASDGFWQILEPARIQGQLDATLARMPAHPIALAGVRQIAQLFAQVADAKSPYMAGHSLRVGRLASYLGELTGVPAQGCAMLEIAGLLHDLGKLQTPDEILNKVGALSAQERAQLDRHGLVGFRILKRVPGLEKVAVWTAFLHAANALPAGVPGVRRSSQPREARILAVAEAFQAMLQERPHRPPMTPPIIISTLRLGVANDELDGLVVEQLVKHVDACWSLASGIDIGAWKTATAEHQPRQASVPSVTASTGQCAAEEDEDRRLVEAVLASGIHIPSMPAALKGLASLRADPDAGPREFAALINKDVALAGAIFRVANSPVFHRGIKVDTIEKAVAVLGLKYTEAVVTSEAMRHALDDPASAQAMKVLWDHLSAVAELCVRIRTKLKISSITLENAYTIGMFHDCGVALLSKRYAGYARSIGLNGSCASILSLDREFQSSHTILGQMVAKNWQLPPELTAVIRHHHDLSPPSLPAPAGQLIALLQLALHMHRRQLGMDDGEWTNGWREVVGERLGAREETVDALLEDFSQGEEALFAHG